MAESTEEQSPATVAKESESGSEPKRSHHVLARTLTVIGVVLLLISVLANFVKREALDKSHFRATSRALIADATIRNQVSSTLVDQLYANVDVSAALAAKLPKNLKGLAGPIAGAAREGTDVVAQRLLERPRVQDAFVGATSLAQQQLVNVLNGKKAGFATTSSGAVVLNFRPLVIQLGNQFSFLPDLQSTIPQNAGQITVLKSNQLKAAQDATKGLRLVADWIWVLVLLAWAGAVWLARGRRRIEVRAIAVGVIASGFLVLLVRTLAGRYLVNHLVVSDSVRPAAKNAYDILTRLLAGAGWTGVIVGAVGLVGVWLVGPGKRAHAVRRAMSPYLARPEIAYTALVVAYLLVLWWKPTPQFGFLLNIVLFLVFAMIGLEALRRLTAREFPDAKAVEPFAELRSAMSSARLRAPHRTNISGELDDLSKLHERGVIDDEEFSAAKARLLGGGGTS
ncbi:MAG TPA: SHOCT domain-containing protein [Gaiellaceae bacterium]|nr:SHOCT domain-containing protein [Gaiellaceae bacterium]